MDRVQILLKKKHNLLSHLNIHSRTKEDAITPFTLPFASLLMTTFPFFIFPAFFFCNKTTCPYKDRLPLSSFCNNLQD